MKNNFDIKHSTQKFIAVIICFVLFSSNVFSQLSTIKKTVNFGMIQAKSRSVEAIIIHSTFNNSGGDIYDIDLVIKQFSCYNVSPHYLIGRDGTIYLMVDEKNIAFHAGKSRLPDGNSAVNSCSLGIELVNSFDESPTQEQIQSLIYLVSDIQSRYKIRYILRHSDIAPDRKTDPWNFDWEGFMQEISKNETAIKVAE
ncbi:MAG: N-acetylmuramoyl-L-alanine amidase [Paludibacter sp.]|nr:N-acetylmuramoyl-L-alanine amidase [Paludibacter sp.]